MGENLSLVEEVKKLLAPILAGLGLELFEIEERKRGRNWLLRIFLTRPDGAVTLDDCQAVSRELDLKMEVENLFPEGAVLEVSSVGLDRPLKKQKDFNHFLGGDVKVKTTRLLDNQKIFLGRITACDADGVTLTLKKGGGMVTIPYAIIAKARLEIAF